MKCTVKEASEMWCHRANNGDDQSCLGPRCMAWVWENESGKKYASNPLTTEYRELNDEERSGHAACMGYMYVLDGEPTGFCGLVDHEI